MAEPHSSGAKRKFDSNSKSASSSDHKKFKPSGDGGKGGDKKPFAKGGFKKPWQKGGDKGKPKPVALSRKERDQMRKDRKAQKPNADIIAEANKIWQYSFATLSASERTSKISDLLDKLSGKLAEVGSKHDASRAIQIAIKYANEQQKQRILAELKGHMAKLAEEHYGHYIIIKFLGNDTKKGEAKKMCMEEFKGHVQRLSTHPDSAKVLDYLYASAKAKEQNRLLQEFYSPEFVVFAEDEAIKDKNLTEILQARPEKKTQIMENLRKYLDKSLEKNMVMFRFIHALLVQYLSHASLGPDTAAEFVPNLHQFIPALHHSIDGCKLICHMLSVGTSAKERKNILKYFKGIVPHMAERQEGVWVLNCALDVVDDTVLLEKVIFAELLPTIKEQLLHQYSAKIYLHVLNSHAAAVFAGHEQDNSSLSAQWILNQNDDAHKPQGPLSKKDPSVKRLELLNCFLLPVLQTLSTLPDTLAALLRTNTGHHLIFETVKETWRIMHDEEAKQAAEQAAQQPEKGAASKKKKKGAAAKDDAPEESKEEDSTPSAPTSALSKFPLPLAKKLSDLSTHLRYLFDALVLECAKPLDPTDPNATDARGAKANPLEDRFGHYCVKRIIATLTPPPTDFIEAFVEKAVQPQMLTLATTNRPAFVLASILEHAELKQQQAAVRKQLQPFLPQIKEAASSKPVVPAVKQEDSSAMETDTKPNKFKKGVQHNIHSTTNAGVELLYKLIQGLPTDKKKGETTEAAAPAPAAATPATPAPKSAKKARKAAEEPVKMEEEEEEEAEEAAAPHEATPPARRTRAALSAKKVTAKKSAKKKTADDMEE